jgi:hypothetical protein
MINLKDYNSKATLIDILKLLNDGPYGNKVTLWEETKQAGSLQIPHNVLVEATGLDAFCVYPNIDIYQNREVKEILPISRNEILIILKAEV